MRTCVATTPPDGKVCGKPAVYLAHWTGDDPPAPVCANCALSLGQLAVAHGTRLKTEKIA